MASAAPSTPLTLSSSFNPPPAKFRSVISLDPASEFPAEPGRYVSYMTLAYQYHSFKASIDLPQALYLHLGCPWGHRTNIVYQLKHLQPVVARSIVSIHQDRSNGWIYDGTSGSDIIDPIEGFENFKQLYKKADPSYQDRYSAPVLWDRKKKVIVNNDSAEIIRIFFTAFDTFLAPELREINKPGGGLYPEYLRKEIDKLSYTIETDCNWGTYKCGMAQSQADYDIAMKHLFERFDEFEERLGRSKYLLGNYITEPDIR
jgi:putative glutathione S-transferase